MIQEVHEGNASISHVMFCIIRGKEESIAGSLEEIMVGRKGGKKGGREEGKVEGRKE